MRSHGRFPPVHLLPFIYILVAIIGASVFIGIWGKFSYQVAGLNFSIRVGIGRPGTTLALPPLGSATAPTHKFPLAILLRLDGIDPDAISRLVAMSSGENLAFSSIIQEAATSMLYRLCLLVLMLGGLGGAAFVYIFIRPARVRRIIGGSLAGILFAVSLMVGTYVTFDAKSFEQARYTGVIEAAPWMLGVLDKSVGKVGELKDSIMAIADNSSKIFGQIEALQPITAEGKFIRVLHVSDLHNNAEAVNFLDQIVKSFKVDIVVDTGDLTDYGTYLEARLMSPVSALSVPYVFVGGNHDSPSVLEAMAVHPNVRLAGGRFLSINGVTIFGMDDPGASRVTMDASTDEEIMASNEKAMSIMSRLQKAPDIIAVHDPRQAEALIGKAPVILYGHDHRLRVQERRNSILIDAGSTGGAGIRGLEKTGGVPMTLALLHFSRSRDSSSSPEQVGLIAVDTITVSQQTGGLTLERRIIARDIQREKHFQ